MQPALQAPRKMRASHHASQGNCPHATHGAKQNNKSENGTLTDQFAADTLRRRAWVGGNCRIRRIEKYSLKTGYQKINNAELRLLLPITHRSWASEESPSRR